MPILLQISWIFQNTPNFLHLYDFEGSCDQKPEKLEIRKFANLSQPWNLAFFHSENFQLFFYPYAQVVPKQKIAYIWQPKEHKNNMKTSKNESHKSLQNWPDVLQHPVVMGYGSSRVYPPWWL